MSITAVAHLFPIVDIFVNDQFAGTVNYMEGGDVETAVLAIPGALWLTRSRDEVQFQFPDPETRVEQQGQQINLVEMVIEGLE